MRGPLVFVAVVLALTLPACSARQQTTTTSSPEPSNFANASPIVEASGGRRSALIGRSAVDLKELALPVYPGAIPAETGGLLLHGSAGVSRVLSLSTRDDFEKVYQWYKQQMPAGSEQAHAAMPHGSIASFLIGRAQDRDNRSVLITENGDKTTILLSRQTKPGASAAPQH